jgi:DNA-directed RNA polymerase sigma subunit (sigma70/sigma32)
MSERIEFGVVKGKLRLMTVKRGVGARSVPRDPVSSLWTRGATQRLISWPDAANWRDLREEIRLILSTLTDHERGVLRMRFGIGEVRHRSVEEIACHYALESGRVLEIEAQALRKLRHPSGRPLKSVSRR